MAGHRNGGLVGTNIPKQAVARTRTGSRVLEIGQEITLSEQSHVHGSYSPSYI